jgi:ABC-2 type transport system permease protein
MTATINSTVIIWNKHMRKFLMNIEELFGTMIQPVLWVTLFGLGMKGVVGLTGTTDPGNYIGFMLPGIVALSAMGGAIGGGMTWLDERVRGILKEYLVAPVPRVSILLGNAASTVSKALIQAILIFLVGAMIGASPAGGPLDWLLALALIVTYSLGFTGLALSVASQTNDLMAYHAMIMLLNLPVLFLSNALYPLSSLPAWMRIGAMANPTSYLVDGMRRLVLPQSAQYADFPLWLCVAVVAAFALAGLALAARSINKKTTRD